MSDSSLAFDDWLERRLSAIDRRSLRRPRRSVRSLPDGWCEWEGRRLRDFTSNDYLGLAHHSDVVAAAESALHETGVGSRASALVTGRTPWHATLEQHLANFEGTEAALLFPSGYAANVGTLSALTSAGDAVFSDELNHASIIDGCRLSRADVHVYPHADITALRSMLEATSSARRFIVTDTVFGMDGDIAPLRDLCELADENDAVLIVDEAHGTGVLGEHGRGACEALGVEGRVPVRIGTLSKSVGCLGGFVCGTQALIDVLWHSARTQFFSTALPPALCAAANAALTILGRDHERRQHLQELGHELRNRLRPTDDRRIPDGITPIVPVILNSNTAANAVADKLLDAGMFVPAIRPPTVPAGTSRLRVSLSAVHTMDDVERLSEVINTA